jgi:hypothetical protein
LILDSSVLGSGAPSWPQLRFGIPAWMAHGRHYRPGDDDNGRCGVGLDQLNG